MNIKNMELASWLASDDKGPMCFVDEIGFPVILIKLPKNPGIDYLFCQKHYHKDDALTRDRNFEYAGIYCKRDGLVYDTQCFVLKPESDQGKDGKVLLEQLKTDVRQRVEAVVGNDRRNLDVSEFTEPQYLRGLEYAKNCGAVHRARKHFLNTDGDSLPVYECRYTPMEWTEHSLLEYIADPEGYAEKEAAGYLAENQEEILYDLLCSDYVRAAYQELLEDSDNPVHSVKRIIQAVRASNAKTVRVTILKNGVEFAFKTETGLLCHDCTGNEYSTWQIEARDRRKFQEIFGRNEKYRPEEIVRIAYGRSMLYQREDKPIGGEAQ